MPPPGSTTAHPIPARTEQPFPNRTRTSALPSKRDGEGRPSPRPGDRRGRVREPQSREGEMKTRIIALGLAALAAIALSSMALAQSVPEQFVVSGKNAEKIQDFTTINLATAERIADSCEKAAAGEGVQISIM